MVENNWVFPKPIVCRPALPMDTPGMLELTRQIWEGEDYVPGTWTDWMADPEGMLTVAEYIARIVGLGKLTKLADSDWWLEGLRVHPAYEGRGIASRINDYLLAYWQRVDSGVIRLATISKREPVKYMVVKRGFKLIGEYAFFKTPFSKPGLPRPTKKIFESLTQNDVDEALEWLTTPGKNRLDFGVMDLGWKFAVPRYEFVENYVEKKQIWWWQGRLGLLVMVKKQDNSENFARIRMLACDRKEYLTCLLDAHAFAQQQGYAGVTWKTPLLPGIQDELSMAGIIQEKDYTLQIYEKSHAVE